MEKSGPRRWIAFSAVAVSTICLAGHAPTAYAADGASLAHYLGHAVVLREMIVPDKTKPTKVHVNVEANTETIMSAIVVYNTSTCAQDTAGAWKIDKQPQNGTDTLAPYTFTLTTGPCAGYQYTGAGIFYTWTANTGSKDKTIGTWTARYDKQKYKQVQEFLIHLMH